MATVEDVVEGLVGKTTQGHLIWTDNGRTVEAGFGECRFVLFRRPPATLRIHRGNGYQDYRHSIVDHLIAAVDDKLGPDKAPTPEEMLALAARCLE